MPKPAQMIRATLGKEKPRQVVEQGCREKHAVELVDEPALSGDQMAPVAHAPVGLDGGEHKVSAHSHKKHRRGHQRSSDHAKWCDPRQKSTDKHRECQPTGDAFQRFGRNRRCNLAFAEAAPCEVFCKITELHHKDQPDDEQDRPAGIALDLQPQKHRNMRGAIYADHQCPLGF